MKKATNFRVLRYLTTVSQNLWHNIFVVPGVVNIYYSCISIILKGIFKID